MERKTRADIRLAPCRPSVGGQRVCAISGAGLAEGFVSAIVHWGEQEFNGDRWPWRGGALEDEGLQIFGSIACAMAQRVLKKPSGL